MTGPDCKEAEVAREIASLATLDRESLVRRWRTVYGMPPPDKLSRALLEKALAYEIQCAAFGGLSMTIKRALRNCYFNYRQNESRSPRNPWRSPGSGVEWGGP